MSELTHDTQTRKWLITINNPQDYNMTHEEIKLLLAKFKSCIYWCMSDEIGDEGTYHTHIYLHSSSGVRFSTVKKKFPQAHLDMCKGTAQENKDYVFKEGKWLKSDKGETNLRDTHEEFGELPIERQGQRNDLTDLYDLIKDGYTTAEIIEQSPSFIQHLDKIEPVRQAILGDRYKDKWRTLEITYIWGDTGVGKTRSVMEKFGYSNVYRVTDYLHPFDSYKSQDVVVFEEFRSSLRIDDMLKYLDGYPVELPSRYINHQACFTKVFILTNIDLVEQYKNVQREQPRTWKAFLRRINKVKYYLDGKIIEMPTEEYLKENWKLYAKNPFESEDSKNEL